MDQVDGPNKEEDFKFLPYISHFILLHPQISRINVSALIYILKVSFSLAYYLSFFGK